MAKKSKILQKILNGSKNVRYAEFSALIEAFGFILARTRGSHQIYKHSVIDERLIIQPGKDGMAKPYQMKQFLEVIEQNNLRLEEDDES